MYCSWSEYCVAVIFILMITLWSTREFGEIRGWDILFQEGYLKYFILLIEFSPNFCIIVISVIVQLQYSVVYFH